MIDCNLGITFLIIRRVVVVKKQQRALPLPIADWIHGCIACHPRQALHHHGSVARTALPPRRRSSGSASGTRRPFRVQAPPTHQRCRTAAHECRVHGCRGSRGAARPPRRRGHRATAPLIDIAAGPQRTGALPLPASIAGSLLRIVEPASPSSSVPLPPPPCARGHNCGGGPGVGGPPRSWRRGRSRRSSPAGPPLTMPLSPSLSF
jgi:hypothetical protein